MIASAVGKPNPKRITMALDMANQHGPEVDEACGVREPVVDLWEAGKLEPTHDQLHALARLTGFHVMWFYKPDPEPVGPMFLCRRGGRCEVIDDRPPAPVIQLRRETLW